MANKMYEETYIQAIADAIREKNQTQDTYLVSEMADAIRQLKVVTYIESGFCGDNVTWELYENGKLIINGTGAMTNYGFTGSPFRYRNDIKNVVISDGVTTIGDNAFMGCTATTIAIPDSVTSIGMNALVYCTNLTSITIPDSVTAIGEYAFSGCANLSSITIPDSVTTIGRCTFEGTAYYNNADNWENDVLYIGKHLIRAKTTLSGNYNIKNRTLTIANNAFQDCSLISVAIPDSITSIGEQAFYYCSKLANVTIGKNVTSIGKSAFDSCSITNVTIPESVTSIGDFAFLGNKFTSITIPASVTSIGEGTFKYCHNLATINVPWAEGTVAGAPWGAPNAQLTINYQGGA